ncbi:MAG: polyprenol monophosphomannose synthase [Acidimicrobiales bacterium]
MRLRDHMTDTPRTAISRPLVVLPTYNEAENIGEVLRRVRIALASAEVLVVDDASPDGTADLAAAAAAEVGGVHVLRRPGKAGLGSAYRAGFRWGLERGYDALVEMDADLQHDPADLPSLVGPLNDRADLVIGSRYVAGGSTPAWAWYRLQLSRWGNRYAGFVLGLGVHDATAGFRAYRADLLRRIDLDAVRADGYGFQIEMCYAARGAGAEVVEVPIRFGDRQRGTSKMSSKIVVEALLLVTWWGFRDRVLRRRRRPEAIRNEP